MSRLATLSEEDLADRTLAGLEASSERLYRIERLLSDIQRRVEEMEGVLLEQFRDDVSEVSSCTAASARYCQAPR